jgi:hypothetical protein
MLFRETVGSVLRAGCVPRAANRIGLAYIIGLLFPNLKDTFTPPNALAMAVLPSTIS